MTGRLWSQALFFMVCRDIRASTQELVGVNSALAAGFGRQGR